MLKHRYGLISFFKGLLSLVVASPCFSQSITQIDGITFTTQVRNDSGFVNFVSPNYNVLYRKGGMYSTAILQQPGNYRALSLLNNDVFGEFKVDSLGISATVNDNTSIQVLTKKAVINADEIWFNGDWIKLPVKTNYPASSNPATPEGSLFYSSITGSLLKSDGKTMHPASWEFPDGDELNPYILQTQWAKDIGYHNLPMLRIRHPLNVTNINTGNLSRDRDFSILPYQYGMAIDYNGVVECWVGEWSIHRGHNYATDVENNNNSGWGGILWVGDDEDRGGVRMTARDATDAFYSEISSEKFDQSSHGPLRLRTVNELDAIDFIQGGRGSKNIFLSVKNKLNVSYITAGPQHQLVLQTADSDRIIIDKNGYVGIGVSEPQSALDLSANNGVEQLRLRKKFTPITSQDERGEPGTMAWDNNYIYIKTDSGWKRAALELF